MNALNSPNSETDSDYSLYQRQLKSPTKFPTVVNNLKSPTISEDFEQTKYLELEARLETIYQSNLDLERANQELKERSRQQQESIEIISLERDHLRETFKNRETVFLGEINKLRANLAIIGQLSDDIMSFNYLINETCQELEFEINGVQLANTKSLK
jgi:predicted nuclease with TOPRIM domain